MTTLLLVFFLDHIYVAIALVLEVVFDVQEGALDSEVHLLFLRIFLPIFLVFLRLVAFLVTPVVSHNCSLLKLLHHVCHGYIEKVRHCYSCLEKLLHCSLVLTHQACQFLLEPFHFFLLEITS